VGLRIRRIGLDRIARRRGLTDLGPGDDVVFERVLASDDEPEAADVPVSKMAPRAIRSDLFIRPSCVFVCMSVYIV